MHLIQDLACQMAWGQIAAIAQIEFPNATAMGPGARLG